MKQNIFITFDLSVFNEVPKLSTGPFKYTQLYDSIKLPLAKIFENVLYKMVDDKIKAFKVLAWALTQCERCAGCELSYLIQFPNEEPRWIRDFIHKAATSVENLINGKFIDSLFHCSALSIMDKHREYTHYGNVMFKNSFRMIDGVVHIQSSLISYLMGTPEGIFIGLSHQNPNSYESREQAIADYYNGVEVIDFAEPIKVEIEVQPTSAVKGILRFE